MTITQIRQSLAEQVYNHAKGDSDLSWLREVEDVDSIYAELERAAINSFNGAIWHFRRMKPC